MLIEDKLNQFRKQTQVPDEHLMELIQRSGAQGPSINPRDLEMGSRFVEAGLPRLSDQYIQENGYAPGGADQQMSAVPDSPARIQYLQEQAQARAIAAQQAEADAALKMQRRAEADAIRAQKKEAQVAVPETGITNERDIDARQRVSRELFGRNYDQLTPEQITEVASYRSEGLGEAVQPQEIADVKEFADLPYSRDQYRSALEVGRAAGVNTKPISMTAVSKQAKVKPEIATQMMDHMVRRGDAQLIDGKVVVDPTAMGPKYSLGEAPSPPPPPSNPSTRSRSTATNWRRIRLLTCHCRSTMKCAASASTTSYPPASSTRSRPRTPTASTPIK